MLTKLKNFLQKYSKIGINYINEKRIVLDRHPIYQVMFYSVCLVFLLEMLSRRSVLKGLLFIFQNPLMFVFNFLIILVTLTVSILVPKKNFFMLLISMIWLLLGVVNFVLLCFRTTPLTAMDFYLLKSVKGIISLYLNTFQIILILLLFVTAILGMIVFWKKSKKYRAQIKISLLLLGGCTVLLALVSGLSLKVNARSTDFGNLADAYHDYGFTFCFSNSIFDRGIDEPKEYSEENVDEVLKKIENEPQKIASNGSQETKPAEVIETTTPSGNVLEDQDEKVTKPNVIMVQLESFFDVNHLRQYVFSENPIPIFSKLKEEYSSGFLKVPSIGAGTANTEFEILTGMNLEHFGAGEYPYKTILQTTTCESISYNLSELGYHTHAIHNNTGTFYDRNKVFQKLGFDSFSSIEYMNEVEYNPAGWAKDKMLTTEIMKALKAEETKDFIFTISVQPHGKYPETVLIENQRIKLLSSKDKSSQEIEERSVIPTTSPENKTQSSDSWQETEQDIITSDDGMEEDKEVSDKSSLRSISNIFAESDIKEEYKNKFEYYVNQLYETDQFIGELTDTLADYQEPTIVVFYGDHLPSLDLKDEDFINQNVFQTEYILWSNFPMETVRLDLNAYQLNAYVMERLGYDNGVLTKFHQRYIDKSDYQDELKLLQYDMLYGSRNIYGGENPYIEKPIHMGVHEIEITNVIEKGEVLFVEGKNFTPWSVVYVSEEPKETLFIDENTLILPHLKYQEEEIYVAQVNDEKIKLSQSKIWNPLSEVFNR